MRVQHNIAAMNSYRNYSNNTKTINKNLEKLSSGYKINRAGDDAAGLAISEKMRAQITGLEGAQKNAKDGISLVQTAEGALTEVHSMLNRMYSLAEQSANGTYEGLDRDQLQKEVGKLRDEINRIADSSNFNGIKLLDGSMGGAAASSASAVNVATLKSGVISDGTTAKQATTLTYAVDGGAGDFFNDGDKFTVTVELSDGSKYSETYTVSMNSDETTATLKRSDDTVFSASGLADYKNVTASEWTLLVEDIYKRSPGLQELYSTAAATDTSVWTSNVASFTTPTVSNVTLVGGNAKLDANAEVTTTGKGAYKQLDASKLSVYKGDGTVRADDAVFTVNGVQFAFVDSAAAAKTLGGNVNTITVTNSGALATDGSDVGNMVDLINHMTGLSVSQVTTATGTAQNKIDMFTKGAAGAAGGLTLQIGDTADKWNKLSVSIEDMHANAMGISGIDISGQSGAQAAMNAIKSAINYVSDTRGSLGATQNRLEHTINNLSVMQENIQDAESTIRDTDVADEMMKYTKNSILVQSAQAMLAQANQQPQGVLQLLQ